MGYREMKKTFLSQKKDSSDKKEGRKKNPREEKVF